MAAETGVPVNIWWPTCTVTSPLACLRTNRPWTETQLPIVIVVNTVLSPNKTEWG